MSATRIALTLCLLLTAACQLQTKLPAAEAPEQSMRTAIDSGIDYLLTKGQAADGSYSAKAGPAITAICTTAILKQGRSPDDPRVAEVVQVAVTPHDERRDGVDVVARVRASAATRGYPAAGIISGAGHDAFHLSRIVPTTMVFVPCRDGISHNPAEYAAPEACCEGLMNLGGGTALAVHSPGMLAVRQAIAAPSGESAEPDWPAARRALEGLQPLLAQDDIRAGDLYRENAAMLRQTLGNDCDALERHIAGYDFEAALTALRHIAGKHEELANLGA